MVNLDNAIKKKSPTQLPKMIEKVLADNLPIKKILLAKRFRKPTECEFSLSMYDVFLFFSLCNLNLCVRIAQLLTFDCNSCGCS